MMPAEIVYMEKLPLLGTGKIDNMAVTKLVKERFAAAPRRSRGGGVAGCTSPEGGRAEARRWWSHPSSQAAPPLQGEGDHRACGLPVRSRNVATLPQRTEDHHERHHQAVIDLQARSGPSRSVAGAQDALRAGDQDRRRLRSDVSVGRDRVAALPQPSASGSRARPSAFDRGADQECDERDQVDPRQRRARPGATSSR